MNTIKKLLRFQHSYLPIPVNIYKYFTKSKLLHKLLYKYFILCYDTDFYFKKPITTEFNQKYWLSKRALYWHYDHLYHNRFTHIFEKVFKKYNHLFENKKVCDLMSGIGPYWSGKNPYGNGDASKKIIDSLE